MTKAEQNEKKQRAQALKRATNSITKEFGKGSITTLGSKPLHVPRFPSGSIALDKALGGGYPEGRIIEIFGAESAGKTTLALETTAEVQKRGGIVAYIDAENALDPSYARALGVNINDLLLSQPDTGEQGLQIANALVKSGAVDLIVVDSVAALVPRQEIEGEMGDQHVGLQARMMSQALRAFAGEMNKTNTTIIFINQLREKVGVMFGNPETTPGGRALKFYSSVRLKINRGKKIKKGTDIVGNHAKIKIVKNKVAPPFKKCIVDIMYGKGISHPAELVNIGVNLGIVDKAGAWYSYHNIRIGQGLINAEKWIEDHPIQAKTINLEIYHKYGMISDDDYQKKLQSISKDQTTPTSNSASASTAKPKKSYNKPTKSRSTTKKRK